MNLTHDAMLVSLRINSWSGRLYDRQASQQVAVHTRAVTRPIPSVAPVTMHSLPSITPGTIFCPG